MYRLASGPEVLPRPSTYTGPSFGIYYLGFTRSSPAADDSPPSLPKSQRRDWR